MKKRLWDDAEGDDPAAGLINLFDVWIAFAAALLLSVVSYMNKPQPTTAQSEKTAAEQRGETLDDIETQRMRAERFQESRASKSGEGERLGTAYRLKSGEIIYVRDKTPPSVAP